jgi:pyrimidine deaminase RibD-like protein
VDLSRCCPPSATAFSVGALVVDAGGAVLATGYSRETGPRVHAEEAALAKLAGEGGVGRRVTGATIYSSLEPCSTRRSRPRSCAQLIISAGIPRVVFALREPPTFVEGQGAEVLEAAGVVVVEIPELAPEVAIVNAHILS